VVAGAISLGVLLELVQGLVSRSPDPWDAVADAIGVGIAFATWSLLRRRAGSDALRTDDVRTGGREPPEGASSGVEPLAEQRQSGAQEQADHDGDPPGHRAARADR
jgi:hypothetical protein